jgi:hypothetical protein
MNLKKITFLLFVISVPATLFGQCCPGEEADLDCCSGEEISYASLINQPEAWYQFRLNYELGFVGVLQNTIQFGSNGTKIDYINDGGEDILLPFERYTAEVRMNERHNVIVLYQPLEVVTRALLTRDLIVDDLTFPQGTGVEFKYGFSFWRISYLYDFLSDPEKELAIGASFQVRNASIQFSSLDGQLFRTNQNIGPVPILKFRTRLPFGRTMWWGSEVDGFYANGKYITGSKADFVGAIYDLSLRMGFRLNYVDPYLNLRFVGGGARGTQDTPDQPGDGFTDNWLHTFSLTVGFSLK